MRLPAQWMWRVVLPVFLLLTLPSCLVVISTSPTTLTGANIIFVAIDDNSLVVASLMVSVTDVDGDWHDDGLTAGDGAFRCAVARGVKRVRAAVTPPSGFVLAGPDRWPREIDVPSAGDVQIEIRVRAIGASAG